MFDVDNRGIITWKELGALLHALGMPKMSASFLADAKCSASAANTDGLSYVQLKKILESHAFHKVHSFNYNRHGADYNARVILKSVELLSKPEVDFTYEDLSRLRLSFTMHEGEKSHGIDLDKRTIQATLKLAGKIVAPRMLDWMMFTFLPKVPRYVQLYELLVLIPHAVHRPALLDRESPFHTVDPGRNGDGVYDLVHPSAFMHPDVSMENRLNAEYEGRAMRAQHEAGGADEVDDAAVQSSSEVVNTYMAKLRRKQYESTRAAAKNKALYAKLQKEMRGSARETTISRVANPRRLRVDTASLAAHAAMGSSLAPAPAAGSTMASRAAAAEAAKDNAPYVTRTRRTTFLGEVERPTSSSGMRVKGRRPPKRPETAGSSASPDGKDKARTPKPPTPKKSQFPMRRSHETASDQFESHLRRMGTLVQAEIEFVPESTEKDIIIDDPNIEYDPKMSNDDVVRQQEDIFKPTPFQPHLRKNPIRYPTPQEYFHDDGFSFRAGADGEPAARAATATPTSGRTKPNSKFEFVIPGSQTRQTDHGRTRRPATSGAPTPYTVRERAPGVSTTDFARYGILEDEDDQLRTESGDPEAEFKQWEDLRTKYGRGRKNKQFYRRAKSAIMLRALSRNSPWIAMSKFRKEDVQRLTGVEPDKKRPATARPASARPPSGRPSTAPAKDGSLDLKSDPAYQQRMARVRALLRTHEKQQPRTGDESSESDSSDSEGGQPAWRPEAAPVAAVQHHVGFSEWPDEEDEEDYYYSSEEETDGVGPMEGMMFDGEDDDEHGDGQEAVRAANDWIEATSASTGVDVAAAAAQADGSAPQSDDIMDEYVNLLMSNRLKPKKSAVPRLDLSTLTPSRPATSAGARPSTAMSTASRPSTARPATAPKRPASAAGPTPRTARLLSARPMSAARKFELANKQWAASMFKDHRAKIAETMQQPESERVAKSFDASTITHDLLPGQMTEVATGRVYGEKQRQIKENVVNSARYSKALPIHQQRIGTPLLRKSGTVA